MALKLSCYLEVKTESGTLEEAFKVRDEALSRFKGSTVLDGRKVFRTSIREYGEGETPTWISHFGHSEECFPIKNPEETNVWRQEREEIAPCQKEPQIIARFLAVALYVRGDAHIGPILLHRIERIEGAELTICGYSPYPAKPAMRLINGRYPTAAIKARLGGPINSYSEARALLNGKDRRKLCNNTYLVERARASDTPGITETAVAVRLHQTDILTYWGDGSIEVSTGGWNTNTTKSHLNAYLPRGVRVGSYREKGVSKLWLIRGWKKYTNQRGNERFRPIGAIFEDGMIINRRGFVLQSNAKAREHYLKYNRAEERKTRKMERMETARVASISSLPRPTKQDFSPRLRAASGFTVQRPERLGLKL
jgi:hypothetical protein